VEDTLTGNSSNHQVILTGHSLGEKLYFLSLENIVYIFRIMLEYLMNKSYNVMV